MAGQRPAPPVESDVGEQPVLDLVPLGGSGREVADGDRQPGLQRERGELGLPRAGAVAVGPAGVRSEEHTSELQSRRDLVCRLLLEKKKKKITKHKKITKQKKRTKT